VPNFAGDSDGSSMRFHDRIGDSQTHTRAGYTVPLTPATVKLGENLIDFHPFNSRSHVRDMKKDKTILIISRDRDWFSV
jgi:hypothetical protein